MLGKLDGLSEYDIRRPLTATGTNLLGLIKHLSIWEARYLGEVFDRPFPEALPQWNDATQWGNDLLGETNRHAGHADILREQLDGRTESGSRDWEDWCRRIEQAATSAGRS